MRQLLLVGLGGFLGALARYGLMGAIYALFPFPPRFPVATLLVNLLGSFLLGIITGIGEFRGAIDASVRAFLVIGFLGSMTTYSTFIGRSVSALLEAAAPQLPLTAWWTLPSGAACSVGQKELRGRRDSNSRPPA